MLETIVGKLGLSFLTRTLSRVLGTIDNDMAQNAARVLENVENEKRKTESQAAHRENQFENSQTVV